MYVKNVDAYIPHNALLGMRFPHDSDVKSDSIKNGIEIIGKDDLALLLRLAKRGKAHRKTIRMFTITAVVNMPISWWIQYDTYKIGTTANSRSRMHTFGKRELAYSDFECTSRTIIEILPTLNKLLALYRVTKEQEYWKAAVDLLPMSYLQERVVHLNYEVALDILRERYNEKLQSEWRLFCDALLDYCPYLEELHTINMERGNKA